MSSISKNKNELLESINTIYPKLMLDYQSIHPDDVNLSVITGNVKGTFVSVADTVSYLIGWGQLVLKWHKLKTRKQHIDFPEVGFKWNELGLLAQKFHSDYDQLEYSKRLLKLDETVNEILSLIMRLDNRELYEATFYKDWTLGRLIQLNTASPMKNVRTKVRRFIRESQKA